MLALAMVVATTLAATRRLVTFDATNTLMRLSRPVGSIYRDALISSLSASKLTRGSELTDAERSAFNVDADMIATAFGPAYKAQCKVHPCFGAGSLASRDWWSSVVRETFVGAGVAEDVVDAEFPLLFPVLYESFGTSATWELFDASAGVVQQLARWRAQLPKGELTLGVISNFDDRLPDLLASLGIGDLFDFVLTSRDHGREKPCASIFQEAASRAGLAAADVSPATCIHIGDTFSTDVVGAASAGWRAIYLASDQALGKLAPSMFGLMAETEHERIPALGFVPRVVGAPAATALPPRDGRGDGFMGVGDADEEEREDDPHADELDEDGERAWFEGLRDDVPQHRPRERKP